MSDGGEGSQLLISRLFIIQYHIMKQIATLVYDNADFNGSIGPTFI